MSQEYPEIEVSTLMTPSTRASIRFKSRLRAGVSYEGEYEQIADWLELNAKIFRGWCKAAREIEESKRRADD